MKKCFLSVLFLLAYFNLVVNNLSLGGTLLLILVIPISITLIFERLSKRFNKRNFIEDFKFLFEALINASELVFLISIVIIAIFPKDSYKDDSNYILFNYIYYSLLIFTFIIINYYGTNSAKLKISIKQFIKSCKKFLKDKFLINVFAIILMILFKNNNNIFIGFVVSYIFFILTEITAIYNRKNNNKLKYNNFDIYAQIAINIGLIYAIEQFDKIFSALTNNKFSTIVLKDYILEILIFILAIVFSNYKDYFINWYNDKKLKIDLKL